MCSSARRMMVLSTIIVFVALLSTSAFATQYNEAPMLAEKVAAGELPPVEQRLPAEPLVVEPFGAIGQYGGTLRFAEVQPHSLWSATCLVSVGLFRYDMYGVETILDIAKGYDFSDDLKTFTIYLREGHQWSDGHPFTVDDIIFWWEDVQRNTELMPRPPAFWRPGGEPAQFIKVSDTELQIKFAVPYPVVLDFVTRTAFGTHHRFVLPKHALSKYHIDYNPDANELAEEAGYDDWAQYFMTKASPANNVVNPTIWPWEFDLVTSTRVTFVRNPYFHQVDTAGNQLPYIDSIDVQITGDREVQVLKATTGELDFETYYLDMPDMPALREGEARGNYRTLMAVDLHPSSMALMPNQNSNDPVLRELFQNSDFRKALSLGINRDRMNEVIFFGLGQPFQATIVPAMSFFQEEWSTAYIEYDPDRANAMLNAIGLTERDSEGFRLRPDGRRLRVRIDIGVETGPKPEMAEMVKTNWEQLGIDTQIDVLTRAIWEQRRESWGNLQISTWHLDRGGRFGRPNPLFYGYESDNHWAPGYERWFNTLGELGEEPPEDIKEHKALFDAYRQTLPGTPEFDELGQKYYSFFAEELPMIGTIGFPPTPIVVSNRLRNVPDEDLTWTSDTNFYAPYMPSQWYLDQ